MSHFKGMSYEDIRPIFERVWDQNQPFVPKDSKIEKEVMKRPGFDLQQESSKKTRGSRKKTLSRKRAREKQSKEGAKRQKTEYKKEKEELKAYLDLVPREEFAMEIESLGTKYLIVDWKTRVLTENFMYYQIIRTDGGSNNYKIFSKMLDDFDRQDVMDLHRLVEERYATSRPEGYDLMLWGDLKILFQPDEEDEVWRHQHEYNLISWILFDSCGIYIFLMDNGIAIHMMIEKKYPLTQEMLSKMLSKKPEVDHENKMAFKLLSGLVVGIESIEPAEMGELNASAMDVESLMSQVSTSIPADVVHSKASDLSTIDGDASEFAGSLNIQVGASKLVIHVILLIRIRTMFAVYVMTDANVANVVEEQKHVSNNDHVACEKKVEEVKGFKGYWNTRWDLL
ncbi:hypothetical protein Tco_0140967 [Tanacetum coccineum]